MNPSASPPPDSPQPLDRLLELLADRATEGLDEAAARELDRLLAQHPEVDPESIDRACAAAFLAMNGPEVEAMPASVRERVRQTAERRMGAAEAVGVGAGDGMPAPERVPLRLPHPARPPRGPVYAGWVVGAMAVVLAAAGWWPRLGGAGGGATGIAAERQRMLTRDGVVRAGLIVPGRAEPVAGDVVWDPAACRGCMRLDGCLPVNDPRVEQYQVWVFDAAGDERYPVHAGVFDVPRQGEVLVPIEPRLRVMEAVRIAVTVEKPGGVWVSDRSRVPLVADLKGE